MYWQYIIEGIDLETDHNYIIKKIRVLLLHSIKLEHTSRDNASRT